MKKSILPFGLHPMMILAVVMMFLSNMVNAQTDKGTFTDQRDGRVYAWLKIGNRAWMAENLKYQTKTGSWAYNDDTLVEKTYGRLYNWKTAQTACPKGWHMPSDKEWTELIKVLGGNTQAGLKMQVMDTVIRVKGAQQSGKVALTTLLAGVRHPDGSCIGQNFWGGFWSSGKINDTVGNNVLFAHNRGDLDINTNDKRTGFSVRCVRNK